MEREVSSAMELAVTLMIVAALLAIVIVPVFMGRGVQENVYSEVAGIEANMKLATMEELADKFVTEMPAATAYNIILQNSDKISYYACLYDIANNTGGQPINLNEVDDVCLGKHLKGKIKLYVARNGEGNYQVGIHSINCKATMKKACTCVNYPHEVTCPQAEDGSYCTCDKVAHGDACPCSVRVYALSNCYCTSASKWSD